MQYAERAHIRRFQRIRGGVEHDRTDSRGRQKGCQHGSRKFDRVGGRWRILIMKRRYPILRHHADSPQLPGGYSAMFVLALVPPLWHRVIDPRVRRFRESAAG